MGRPHVSKDFWIGALRTEGPAFAAAVADAPPETPVVSRPGWTVTDLVLDLAGSYRFAHDRVAAAQTTAPQVRRPERPEVPAGSTAFQVWRESYERLLALFEGLDPEAPAWNWAPQPKRAGFWPRRMAHDTALHRWDAQLAVAAVEPVEAKLAADGVSEVLDTFLPAGRRPAPGQWRGVVQLVATDAGQEWFLRLRGEGVALLDTSTILDHDDHHARAHVVGNASDLLLALWGRVEFDTLKVTGDQSLLAGLRVA